MNLEADRIKEEVIFLTCGNNFNLDKISDANANSLLA